MDIVYWEQKAHLFRCLEDYTPASMMGGRKRWIPTPTTMAICITCAQPISHLYIVYESAYNLRLEQCVSVVQHSGRW